MANMSYCRFSNTQIDLRDCLRSLRNEEELSDFEAKAGREMFVSFLDYCMDMDIIDAYDENLVNSLFEQLDCQYVQETPDENGGMTLA